jgi:hypothetical protein
MHLDAVVADLAKLGQTLLVETLGRVSVERGSRPKIVDTRVEKTSVGVEEV